MRNLFGKVGLTTLAIVAGAALPAAAQGTQTANIRGKVVQKSGASLAGAVVRISSPALQIPRTLTTDEGGVFISRLLPPGAYTIEVVKQGFQTVRVRQQIGIGTTFEPRLQMIEEGSAQVEVVATSIDVDKTDVKTSTTYLLDRVDALPTGRTMEAVALLTPGVTSGVGGRVQIRGGMTSGNLYLMDGQNISDNAYNNRGISVIDDSIEEVQVLTGAISAEYGNTDGGVLNAVTRQGGNEFKGQLRWELSNPAWNSFKPMQPRTALQNKLNEEKTLSLSGYIIKDRLWFAGSFFQTDQSLDETIGFNIPVEEIIPSVFSTGNGPGGSGSPYSRLGKEIRRQIKLTYSLNENHQFVLAFANSRNDQQNRNYSAGELASLVPQLSTSEFYNVQWRGIWGNAFSTELKLGKKNQLLSAGGAANGKSPIYNYDNGGFYNNGIFNNTDGGDNRKNETANFKATYIWNAAGSHESVAGIDYYKGISKARNEQTPTGYIFGVYYMNLAQRKAFVADVWTYQSGDGEAQNFSEAIFVNDKWTVNDQLSIQMGLRFDRFRAIKEDGSQSAGASGLSPRFGVSYDVIGDGKWVTKFSYNRYNGKVLEGITNAVTSQGNPTEIDHPYIGPDGPQDFAYFTNLANLQTLFDFGTISYYANPTLNIRLSDNLKAPTVDELQLSLTHAFNYSWLGKGHVTATLVKKDWKNLFDYRQGNDGRVLAEDGSQVYLRVWENSDIAERKYEALEIDGHLEIGPWTIDAGVTWSTLRGNYEGEGGSTPARGEGLKAFTIQDGVRMYDINITSPYGYLNSHNPLRIRGMAAYTSTGEWGKTTYGLVYNFDSGARYSTARTIGPKMLNPALSGQYGTTATQFLGERNEHAFNSTAYLDLAITHEVDLFKVGARPVSAMLKLNIQNFLNHQQQLTWDVAYARRSSGSLTDPFVRSSTWGHPVNANNYGAARSIRASFALRF